MMKYIPLVLFIFSWPVLSADIHGRGVRVLDGDTIEVMDSRKAVRIRLVNIDAPEKKQDYGRWSTDMMKSLVAGKTVTVTYFQRDRYGRILGQVYAPDGMNINQFMVRAGAAWVYEQYNTDPVLPVLQNEARQQKRGLWSDADPVPPWIWRLNRPGFPGECFICELRLPDQYFRWKHNKLFLLLPEEYGPAFPAIVDCYTSPPTLVWPVPLLSGFSSSYGVLPPLCKDH